MALARAVERIPQRGPLRADVLSPSKPAYPLPEHALERHYSVIEVAKMWGLSENTIRRMFVDEPGVIEWGSGETRFKRAYKTLRIPESVLQRVHRRHVKAG